MIEYMFDFFLVMFKIIYFYCIFNIITKNCFSSEWRVVVWSENKNWAHK